jgi:hypothetical protein
MQFAIGGGCRKWTMLLKQTHFGSGNSLWMAAVNRMLLTSGDDCFLNDTVTAVVTSKG